MVAETTSGVEKKPWPVEGQRWAWIRGEERREYVVETAGPMELGDWARVTLRRTDGEEPRGLAQITAGWLLNYASGGPSGHWEPLP